jgi:hypothetical protein
VIVTGPRPPSRSPERENVIGASGSSVAEHEPRLPAGELVKQAAQEQAVTKTKYNKGKGRARDSESNERAWM